VNFTKVRFNALYAFIQSGFAAHVVESHVEHGRRSCPTILAQFGKLRDVGLMLIDADFF